MYVCVCIYIYIHCHEREGSVGYKCVASSIGLWIYLTLAAYSTCDYNLLYGALANSHSYSL
jgi:hypothetical protein